MYQTTDVGIENAMLSITTMLTKARNDFDKPISIAIVDSHGVLVTFARMDNCLPLPQKLAYKKAYTASIMKNNTADIEERFKNNGRNISDFGDANLITLKGGITINNPADNAVIGAIGVSGLTADQDEMIANMGLNAMNL
jgi:glc operon protein GlcG